MAKPTTQTETVFVTAQEKAFLEYVRKLSYGKLEVVVKDGQPIRGENIRQSTLFQQEP